jgi:hypothetical protein
MNALTPITIGRLPALMDADLDAADDCLRAEKSPGTRRAYASDYRIFVRYCADRGACAMPARAETDMAFLAAEARGGARASTLGRRVAAIRYAHKLAGHEPPTNSEAVKAVIRGIRRSIGTAKTQKVPATADLVRQMLDACPDTMRGKRDRAHRGAGVPPGQPGWPSGRRGAGCGQRGRSGEGMCSPSRARCDNVRRPQPAVGLSHQRGGAWRVGLQADGGVQAQERRRAERIRTAIGHVQGPRWIHIPVAPGLFTTRRA